MNAHFKRLIQSSALILAIGSPALVQASHCPPSPPSPCCFEQGYGLCDDKIPAGYNAQARFDVQCKWDFFVTGSFIYWHTSQDGMELAYLTDGFIADGKAEIQKFEFKPGFKVGIGMDFDHDNWVGALEYTWLRQQTHFSKDAPEGHEWHITDWLTSSHLDASTISSKWNVHFDMLDATLSRPFYRGRSLTVTPLAGMRGAWIRQHLYIDATNAIDGLFVSHNLSQCWSAGPRAGLQAHWLIGAGFRMEGAFSESLLFTRYTKISHQDLNPDGTIEYTLRYHDYNTVHPMTDMGVGIGWGSYFACQHYHVDLLATYDFNVIWGQNMMRSLVDTHNSNATFEAANLYLQGLTATARFDF